jgi:DNA repair protein RadA/Sms
MAVLEKRGGINLSGCDCYVSIAGGIKVSDPASDLGIICAIASSYRNRPVGDDTVIIGEVGLAGEIRGVQNILQRVKEADKLGYRRVILPKACKQGTVPDLKAELIYVSSIQEALERI